MISSGAPYFLQHSQPLWKAFHLRQEESAGWDPYLLCPRREASFLVVQTACLPGHQGGTTARRPTILPCSLSAERPHRPRAARPPRRYPAGGAGSRCAAVARQLMADMQIGALQLGISSRSGFPTNSEFIMGCSITADRVSCGIPRLRQRYLSPGILWPSGTSHNRLRALPARLLLSATNASRDTACTRWLSLQQQTFELARWDAAESDATDGRCTVTRIIPQHHPVPATRWLGRGLPRRTRILCGRSSRWPAHANDRVVLRVGPASHCGYKKSTIAALKLRTVC